MKDINQLLDHQKLHDLIHHAASLRKLDAVLEAILPPAIKGHVHSARLEDHTLTLITPNASYATQVRFSSGALLAALNQQMPQLHIKSLSCRVKPAVVINSAKPATIDRRISDHAADSIIKAAASMSDERLRKIWQNLGSSAVACNRNRRRKTEW